MVRDRPNLYDTSGGGVRDRLDDADPIDDVAEVQDEGASDRFDKGLLDFLLWGMTGFSS